MNESNHWKILMVDDDEDDYVLARQMLAESRPGKYTLDWADSFDAGWEKIQAGAYDAVLMDYDLGPHNGLELTRKAVDNDCGFPIILFTGRGSYEVDLQAMQAGAALYLTKSEISPLLLERGIRYAIERKQSEKALAEANQALTTANACLSQQKLELDQRLQERSQILGSIQDGFFSIDRDWTITYMNHRASRTGGYEPEQVIGKNFWEVFPKVKGTEIELQYRRAMAARTPIQFEAPRVYQDKLYNLNIYPSVEGISVFAQDISERKQAEAERERLLAENRQQRAFLERLIQTVPVAISVLEGPGHRYTLTNPHQEFLSRGKGDLHGRTVAEVWAEASRQVLPLLDQAYQTGEPYAAYDVPFDMIRDHGPEVAYFDVSYTPMWDPQGQVEGILALAVETTEQVAARRELESQRASLLAVINSAPAGIVVTDTQARILTTNELASQLYARPVPAGQDFTSHAELALCHPDGTPYAPCDLPLTRAALDGETTTNLEMLIVWPDGQRRPLLVNTAPVRDPAGRVTGAVGIFQDISLLKQAAADLALYTQRLEKSSQELQDFTFMASHDMQEPLRKVLTFSDRLQTKAGPKLDAEERDYLDRMRKAAGRMSIMLDGLLAYSRVSTKAQPFEPVDLARVAAKVWQDLEDRGDGKKAQVDIGALPVIEAEPAQMYHLLQNLIGNALKFARPDVPPNIKICSCRLDKAAPGGPPMVEIRVEDNGIGFDPQAAGQLFLPFHRLVGHSQFEGSGMGLAICRKIVERHGGTITALGQAEQGAVFIVQMPVKQAVLE